MLSDYIRTPYSANTLPPTAPPPAGRYAANAVDAGGSGGWQGGSGTIVPGAPPPNPNATPVAPPTGGLTPQDLRGAPPDPVVLPTYSMSPYGGGGGQGYFNGGTPPGFSPPPSFQAPAFQGVDPQQIANDPSYQFRLQQGMGALQRSAAAQGTLQTGGTLRSLMDYGQNSASQEYANAYNRALQTWQQTQYNPALAAYNSQYKTAQDVYQSQYDPWFSQGNWGNQGYLQGQQIDYNAWNAWMQDELAQRQMLLNGVNSGNG